MVNRAARHSVEATTDLETETFHGRLIATNGTSYPLSALGGTFSFLESGSSSSHMIKGSIIDLPFPMDIRSYVSRLLPGPKLAMVSTAFPLVDATLSCALIFDVLIAVEPAIIQEHSAIGNGHILLCGLCGE